MKEGLLKRRVALSEYTAIVRKKGKRMFVLLSFYLKSSHFNHELESRKILLLTKESYAMYVTKVQGSQLQIIYLWRNCIIMLHNPYSYHF